MPGAFHQIYDPVAGSLLASALVAATHGMAFGFWPISWIVLNAVFYNLTVRSGDFDVIRRSLDRLTEDGVSWR